MSLALLPGDGGRIDASQLNAPILYAKLASSRVQGTDRGLIGDAFGELGISTLALDKFERSLARWSAFLADIKRRSASGEVIFLRDQTNEVAAFMRSLSGAREFISAAVVASQQFSGKRRAGERRLSIGFAIAGILSSLYAVIAIAAMLYQWRQSAAETRGFFEGGASRWNVLSGPNYDIECLSALGKKISNTPIFMGVTDRNGKILAGANTELVLELFGDERLSNGDEFGPIFDIAAHTGEWAGSIEIRKSPNNLANLIVKIVRMRSADFFVTIVDLSEYEKTRKAVFELREMGRLGNFAAGFGHEIRSTLQVLRLSAENLAAEYPESASCRIGKIISGIVKIDQIERAIRSFVLEGPQEATAVDLCDALMAEIDFLKENDPQVNVNIGLPQEEAICLINEEEIKIAIRNILKNAIRHSRLNGSVNVEVYLKIDEAFHCANLEILDNGNGFGANFVPPAAGQIYKSAEKIYGLGYGLSMVTAIVDKYGGKITFSDYEGGGRVFVCLPMIRV